MTLTATTKVQTDRRQMHRFALGLLYLCLMAVAAIVLSSPASGQTAKKKEAAEKDEKPKLRAVTLKTKDGVVLRAFYQASNKGKEAPTVLLVHEWNGQASPYGALVRALSDAGCAVLVPDYRGHGGSSEYKDMKGTTKQFNRKMMNKRDIESIVSQDMEQAKRFLKEENNDKKLNLNALVVIGVREGCVMGAHWAARDWTYAQIGAKKRGQDVKAMVLISPKKTFKGVAFDQALTAPILSMPMMLVVGRGSPEAKEAERIYKRVETVKKKAQSVRDKPKGLEMTVTKSSLSGPRLALAPEVISSVVKFVTSQVNISEEENPWVER